MKMVLGTVKGKVIAGVVAVGLVSGVGSAFANTDAGAQLQNWYNAKFKVATQQSATDLARYGVAKVPGLNKEKDQLKGDTVGRVSAAGTAEITRATGEINAAKQGYIDAINSKQTAITNAMQGQFDSFVTNTNSVTNNAVNAGATLAQNEISAAVNAQGTTSLTDVNNQVTSAKTTAVAELTNEINQSKADLQSLISQKQAAATQALKDNLDAQISAKRTEITNAIAALELAKKNEIATKGQEIEASAKSELDALVGNINK